jgi:predicted deacylase
MVLNKEFNKEKNSGNKSIFDYSGKFSIKNIYPNSGGYIAANRNLFANMINTPTTKIILKEAVKGTPLIKLGSGDLKVIIIAGIHGNELPSQNAAITLIDKLKDVKLNGTVYVIPFAAPEATMYNSRNYRGKDINRTSMVKGFIGNVIIEKIQDLGVNAVGDFHSTAPNANPGKEGVFCTLDPCPESFNIASFISEDNNSSIINYNMAGIRFKGALEDECNLNGIPAVTCEVLSNNGTLSSESTNRSLLQMFSFLKYFKII